MTAQDWIRKKRDGGELSPDEIKDFVAAVVEGGVSDAQAAAMLMAMFIRGMNRAETVALTKAMLRSGEVLDLSGVPGCKVDKHSTGGVGDKVSLVLAPLVAAAGVPVPMISGRGLGHTGGTLDKLEAVPGFSVDLAADAFARQVEREGLAIIGQSRAIAPADKILYALRDATATVECLPLICASILSKKLAEGIDALVLDVKFGRGAFMEAVDDARELGQALVDISAGMGVPATALLTDMNDPLGRAVGNALEVVETVDCLEGEGPSDLMEVTMALGVEMLAAAGMGESEEDRRGRLREALDSGRARERFDRFIAAQGGKPEALRDGARGLPHAHTVLPVHAPADAAGYIKDVDARKIGRAAMILGAGRKRDGDTIDPAVGVSDLRKRGEPVGARDVLCHLHINDDHGREEAVRLCRAAFRFVSDKPESRSMVLERLQPVTAL
ncbi:MAG: thymidine phosphorylase [Opitutales bacterium]|nr:thymidine phosphorylase [Opitutales bacterium]